MRRTHAALLTAVAILAAALAPTADTDRPDRVAATEPGTPAASADPGSPGTTHPSPPDPPPDRPGDARPAAPASPGGSPAPPGPPGPGRPGTPVITADGLAGIEFGATRAALVERHGLRQEPGDCAARLPAQPAVSPVFDGDRLVLLWADPPVRTPEGLGVGTPVGQVRAAHPTAVELTAPSGSYRFDGILVPAQGDRAYLFLHDRERVQKLIVGYEPAAREFFAAGGAAC